MTEAERHSGHLSRPWPSSAPNGSDVPRVPPAPLLLQGQDYFFRSPDNALDFQERMHQAGMVADDEGDPTPCVLVLARAADMEMNELSLALAEHNIRMLRIDADRCLDLALTVYTDAPLIEFGRWLLRPVARRASRRTRRTSRVQPVSPTEPARVWPAWPPACCS